MIEGLDIYPDFLSDVDKIRKHALLSEFRDFNGPDGETYKRVAVLNVPGVQAKLEELYGPIHMLGQGYRLNYTSELPNHSIHSDLGWGTRALVYYLSEGRGGTAFWKHHKTQAIDIYADDVDLLDKVKDDWNNVDAWEMRYQVDMMYGTAIVYNSSLFHSRWPFPAFGTTPETGRLIAVAFFTPESDL